MPASTERPAAPVRPVPRPGPSGRYAAGQLLGVAIVLLLCLPLLPLILLLIAWIRLRDRSPAGSPHRPGT